MVPAGRLPVARAAGYPQPEGPRPEDRPATGGAHGLGRHGDVPVGVGGDLRGELVLLAGPLASSGRSSGSKGRSTGAVGITEGLA